MIPHKFKVYCKNPGDLMTGYNTVLEMDGEVLRGVTRFSFDVSVEQMATIKLEMLGEVEIEGIIPHSDPAMKENK